VVQRLDTWPRIQSARRAGRAWAAVRVTRRALGGVGEVQASHGGDLQAADLHAVVAAVAGVILGWDVAPRQGGQLAMQGGLVGLYDQDVGGVLGGDQPVGVVAMGVQCVGVMTRPARSSPSSRGRNRAISLVV
jgi:hypothetical protein